LLKDLGDGWCEVEKSDGMRGLVPQSYLNLNQNVVVGDAMFGDDISSEVAAANVSELPSTATSSGGGSAAGVDHDYDDDDDDEGMKMLNEATQLAAADESGIKLKKVVMKVR
jgi:hypothetical protein